MNLSRDNGDLQSRVEEAEDELDEVLKKNKQLIAQVSIRKWFIVFRPLLWIFTAYYFFREIYALRLIFETI